MRALLHFRDRCANGKRRVAITRQPLAVAVGDRPLRPVARPALAPPRTSGVAMRPTLRHPPGHRPVQTVGERVPIGGAPFDVALSPYGDVLVTRPHASAVDMLHRDPLRVVSTIRVGPAPTRIVPGGRSQWAYVTSQFAEAVCIVDLGRKQQVGSIPVPGHPLGAAMARDGVTLFATTNQDRVVAISSLQRTALGSAPVPLGCPELTVHPSGRWVYVPCWRAGVVVEVDASTLETTRRFDVGGVPQDVRVSSDGQTLYVANEAGWLDVIHLPSGRRTATVDFGTPAFGVALSCDERYVFVSLLTAGRVVVLQRQGLDGPQRRTVSTIRDSAHSLLRIIDDVLDFSKIEAGRLELEETAFSLSGLIEGVAGTFRQQAIIKGLALDVEIDAGNRAE